VTTEVNDTTNHKTVDYLIIGAGIAGTTLKHFLGGDITLLFMNLWDRPYPLGEHGRALFDALESAIGERLEDWTALGN
jgi:hypothetical protein